ALGQTIEFLATPSGAAKQQPAAENGESGPPTFFGLPLEEDLSSEGESGSLVAKKFRIVGVLNARVKEGAGQGGMRGLFPGARISLSLAAAAQWAIAHSV